MKPISFILDCAGDYHKNRAYVDISLAANPMGQTLVHVQ